MATTLQKAFNDKVVTETSVYTAASLSTPGWISPSEPTTKGEFTVAEVAGLVCGWNSYQLATASSDRYYKVKNTEEILLAQPFSKIFSELDDTLTIPADTLLICDTDREYDDTFMIYRYPELETNSQFKAGNVLKNISGSSIDINYQGGSVNDFADRSRWEIIDNVLLSAGDVLEKAGTGGLDTDLDFTVFNIDTAASLTLAGNNHIRTKAEAPQFINNGASGGFFMQAQSFFAETNDPFVYDIEFYVINDTESVDDAITTLFKPFRAINGVDGFSWSRDGGGYGWTFTNNSGKGAYVLPVWVF